MRHLESGKRLGRRTSWRKATVRDLARAVLFRQRIITTSARAKEARKLIDRLITIGKTGTLAAKRQANAVLCDHALVSDLFGKIAPRFNKRQGGYTRIIPLSFRRGDHAQMVFLELTEKDELIISKAKAAAAAKAKSKAKKAQEEAAEMKAQEHPEVKEETPGDKKAPLPKAPQPTAAPPTKKHAVTQDQAKGGKNIMGGIKRMFQRKTGE